jgi:exonuclease SbcC
MKILRIGFQNLNSLAGKWQVDFTRAEYSTSGIFAITGPTGSGKTTLLDAICLALYGRTPRLDRISESTNEIMSRHTGACFAEIEFATKKGHFRCHWSQRRAREKSSGKLQQPRHEIVDAQTNKVLENKIKEVAKRVEEVCGMNFDQFTRSVLLAQGGFAAFLDAKGDERAPILEQITGTEIYSRISQKVHQKKNEEQQKLELLEKEIDAVSLLSDEELKALQQELEDKNVLAKKEGETLATAQKNLNWLTGLTVLQEDIAALEQEARQVRKSLEEAEPERVRLSRAQKANLLSGSFAQLLDLRRLQNKERVEKEATKKELAELHVRLEEMQQTHQRNERLVKEAKSAYQRETELCRHVRELDVKLAEAEEGRENLKQQMETTAKQLQLQKKALAEKQAGIADKDKELEEIRTYQRQHQKDADLTEDLTGFLELGKSTDHLRAKTESLAKELAGTQDLARQSTEHTKKAQEIHEHDVRTHANAKDLLTALQNELADLLHGRNPAHLRAEQSRRTELFHQLEKIVQLAKQKTEDSKEITELRNRRQEASAQAVDAERRRQETAEKILLQQQVIEKQRQLVFLAGRIHDYEEERKRLADGEPCPLCGSLVHPFCSDIPKFSSEAEQELQRLENNLGQLQNQAAECKAQNATAQERIEQSVEAEKKVLTRLQNNEKTYTELANSLPCPADTAPAELARLDRIRKQEAELLCKVDEKTLKVDEARQEEEKRKDIVHTSLEALQQAQHAENTASENSRRLHDETERAKRDLNASLKDLSDRLAPYGVESLTIDSLGQTLATLSRRSQLWKQNREREQKIIVDQQQLRIELERLKSLLEKITAEAETSSEQHRLAQKRLDELRAKRRELYQDKDPELEEKQAAEMVSKAEAEFIAIEGQIRHLEKDNAVLHERHSTLERSLTKRARDLEGQEKDFHSTLAGRGFADEADFQSAVLNEQEMEELAASLEKLAKQEAEIATRLADKNKTLELERTKELTEQSLEQLKELIRDQTEAVHLLQQQVGRIQGKLQDNHELINKQQSRLEARQKQQNEYRRWLALHDLIGSSDGKKFRNFAQGVTFEIMIGHANRSLQMMTDRYILVRDALQPLELNVVDTYQAGEIRSTKNLSGGESFIVSLSLALGLAGMAGNDVRVDSLFLDEGFGTLDEDSLETALETLAGLQQEGKIIGIISHVPALQERIATRIQVLPGPSGTSSIAGPGVSRL